VPVVESPFKDRDRFVLGTLSHAVVHSAGTRYESLPDWPTVPPDHDLRDQGEPMIEEKSSNRFSSSRQKDTEAFLNGDDDVGSSLKSGYSSSIVSSGSQSTSATDADDTSQTTLTSSSEEDDEEDAQEEETKSDDDEDEEESEEDPDSSEIVIMVTDKAKAQVKMEESSEEGSEYDDSVHIEDDDDEEEDDEDVEQSKPSKTKHDDFLLLFPQEQKVNERPKSAKAEAMDAFDMMMGGPAAGTASANYSPMDDLLSEMNSRPKAMAPKPKRSFSLPTVGACGVLLEEQKTEGLRVEYSYLRRDSGFGKNYILVGLTFRNTGSESITNVKLRSVDQGVVIKGFKSVEEVHAGELVSREISIESNGKNNLPLSISAEEEEHQCRLEVPYGEAMRPNPITSAEFLQNQQRLSGMQSQNKKVKGINLEKAVAGFTRCFNVAAIQEDVGANYIARFASTLLSSKNTMLIELKEGRDKNSVSFHVNSEDFFELTSCITAISKIVF